MPTHSTETAAKACMCRLCHLYYPRLLGTFGGEDVPCCGFGFGDAVIVELLKDRAKLPEPPHKVGDPNLLLAVG